MTLALKGFVVDDANLVSPEAEAELEADLAAIAVESGLHVLIVITPNLEGEDVSRAANRLMLEWLEGKPRPIIAAIYLLAPNDRVMALSATHSLPPGSTADDISKEMAQNLGQFIATMERDNVVVVRPLLRQKDYDGGLRLFAKLAASEAARVFAKSDGAETLGATGR